MKKFLICLLIILIIAGGFGAYYFIKDIIFNGNIKEIKKGWYVEITNEYINVREKADTDSKVLGKVYKNEVYKVIEMNFDNSAYFWYKIEYKGKKAWIASGRKIPYLKDYNNPTDILTPTIKYYEDVYKVVSIDDINYKHLEIIEDKDDYKIEHVIYHEVEKAMHIDQYWILYTVTDAVGKSSSKLQQIEFEEEPDESEVIDFSEYK